MSEENLVTRTKEDVAVFRAVVSAGLRPTPPVIHSLWRWFSNVDLVLPLPVMSLGEKDRQGIALNILNDLDVALDKYGEKSNDTLPQDIGELNHGPETVLIDNMWKELAHLYADLLNKEVPNFSDEDKKEITADILESISEAFGLDREGVIQKIKTDPSLKLSLRMMGLSPEDIING